MPYESESRAYSFSYGSRAEKFFSSQYMFLESIIFVWVTKVTFSLRISNTICVFRGIICYYSLYIIVHAAYFILSASPFCIGRHSPLFNYWVLVGSPLNITFAISPMTFQLRYLLSPKKLSPKNALKKELQSLG